MVLEERDEVEENEEEREEKSDDFLSGTGGFVLHSLRDLVLGREEAAGDRGKEEEREEENGEGWEKAPGLGVRGEEGVMGEETGVPGVGVLD